MTGYGRSAAPARRSEPANLADILERVLDKGIVIAGDIQVNLLDIELLTIKLRLVIASVDRAKEMGIDWWEHDPTLSSGRRESDRNEMIEENRRLRDRIAALEAGAEEVSPSVGRSERTAVDRAVSSEEDFDRRERRSASRLDSSELDSSEGESDRRERRSSSRPVPSEDEFEGDFADDFEEDLEEDLDRGARRSRSRVEPSERDSSEEDRRG
jgi:hypothetical protein